MKIGSREEAEKAWSARKRDIADRFRDRHWSRDAEKKKNVGRKISAAKSTDEQREAQSSRSIALWENKREDIRESMKKSFNTPEMRHARKASALITNNDPGVRDARDAGLKKAVQRAADPKVMARSRAEKMREQSAQIGKIWTEEQVDAAAQNILREILERRARKPEGPVRRKRSRGGQPEPIYDVMLVDWESGRFEVPQLAEKYFPGPFKRDKRGTIHQVENGLARAKKRKKRKAA